jgi:arylsulfatase A-like enzyme
LTGGDYPQGEFASIYGEQGFGGLHYTDGDDRDPVAEGALNPDIGFDCLNSWSQSGTMRMLRKGDWKLAFDMQGRGQLYNLRDDPVELNNLYAGNPAYAELQKELLADLLAWTLRAQDPLPPPGRRYAVKADKRNYWAPYR